MKTVLIGAVLNVVLDPVFIFVFGMGVRGAAIATVISQAVSAAWVVKFLAGKRARCGCAGAFCGSTANCCCLRWRWARRPLSCRQPKAC